MKIFGIGLTRTGTTSLTKSLEILGYSAVHCPHSYEEIDKHDAATDTPVAARFPILDYMYPNSKFIFTTRDIEDWIHSASSISRNKEDPLWKLEGRLILWKSLVFNKEKFIHGYYSHHNFVMDYFKHRAKDLLILPIEEKNKWNLICGFLNKKIPKTYYPHLNKRYSLRSN